MMPFIKHILTAPLRWLRAAYDWTIHWAKTPQAPHALFWVAFIESSFFPIPPDVLLIATTVASPKNWWRNALICSIGSVLGALLGYAIGWFFFNTIGQWIINTYHLQTHVETVRHLYTQHAFLAILTAAFTPIPYKVFTIAAGLFKISIPVLILASVIGRSGRFFLVAGLLRLYGEKISGFIEKYFDILSVVFMFLLIGSYYLIKILPH